MDNIYKYVVKIILLLPKFQSKNVSHSPLKKSQLPKLSKSCYTS